MSDGVRSMILGPSVLYLVALVAFVLTVTRHAPGPQPEALDRVIRIYLLGIAAQCFHFVEEFVSGFHVRAPQILGLVPWSAEFFVTFNLTWIALWVVSAVGIRARLRIAFFPAWFFAVGMLGNGLWHPLLSARTAEYFPGLFTSPVVGAIGLLLAVRLWNLTAPGRRVLSPRLPLGSAPF